MKQVRRLFFCLTILIGIGFSAQGQACDPDTTTPGIPALYPDTLADGMQGVQYDAFITLVIPQDSVVNVPPFGSLTIDICSLTLDSVPNLPAGMTYACNTSDCAWTVNHDSAFVNRGCVALTGIPQDSVPNDTLDVFVTINPGAYDAALDSCLPLAIALPPELTTVQYRTRLFIKKDSSFVNIEDYTLNDLGVKLYPNPTQGLSNIEYTLPERADDVKIRLVDVMGRTVQEIEAGPQQVGTYRHTIGAADLTKGIYLVAIELNNGANVLTRKLIIE